MAQHRSFALVLTSHLLALLVLQQARCDDVRSAALENLASSKSGWKRLRSNNDSQFKAAMNRDSISIHSRCTPTIDGLFHTKRLKGNFEIEATFRDLMNGGLGLISTKGDTPDSRNYLAVVFEKNSKGEYVFRVQDMQQGKPDVFDSTGELARSYEKGPLKKLYDNGGLMNMSSEQAPNEQREIEELVNDRYHHVLNRGYSVSFDKSNGRIKIVRNSLSSTFHLYYGVTKSFGKKKYDGWIEFAPVKDWMGKNSEWLPGLYVARDSQSKPVKIECSRFTTRKVRKEDIKKDNGQFAVTRRQYTWSGFDGEAVVVSFDKSFPFLDEGIKFVFWERANYVPVWHLSNQLQFCYEFVETWDKNGIGCYEPMSDRLGVASRVKILEDNPVRKQIKWNYTLLNPDYETPDNGIGKQLPEAEEIYTFYPDGRIIRHITYMPKLDGSHRRWNELCEFIVIAGNRFNPREKLASPALTVVNESGTEMSFFPGRPSDLSDSEDWKQIMASAHFRDKPDAFVAFSNAKDTRDTNPGLSVRANVSWHGTGYRMTHWPVGVEPYLSKDKTPGSFRSQVAHTSLLGIGAHRGAKWKDKYSQDSRGRRKRDWAALLSLTSPGDLNEGRRQTNGWLYPGTLSTAETQQLRLVKVDRQLGEVVLKADRSVKGVSFVWNVHLKSSHIYKPCFRIIGELPSQPVVRCNGQKLMPERDFRTHKSGSDLLLWLNIVSSEALRIEIGK